VSEGKGEVVGIVKRNWRAYAGSIDERDCEGHVKGELVRVVPVDPRVPKIRIRTKQVGELSDKRIIVNIDSWSR
jgi:exosome complex exonuclease DIS3/RRP44